jgi:competence protein ComEC
MDDYRITMLDVGQGQCILLQSKGKTFMVDCGGSYDETAANTAASTLLSQGILQLDGLILTHHDEDHIGAAAYLLQRVSAEVLILPDIPDHEPEEAELLAHHTGQVLRCTYELDITWKDTSLRIFGSQNAKDDNESSLCVLFQTEKCDILITGDRSIESEFTLATTKTLPKLDILVAGHHGSKNSTGDYLLGVTRPDLVLISVGKDNSYGHPAEQTLARLEAYGCQVRRTDLDGTIIIRG